MAYVASVDYFEHELMPGRAMFRCERLAASLQVVKCADMWRAANAAKPAGCERCQRCAVGAAHAGEAQASMSAIRASGMCVREGCNRQDQRLIGGLICVSCYNRAREQRVGKNAKGRAPVKLQPLCPRRVRYFCSGSVVELRRCETSAMSELVVEVLRDNPKRAFFGRGMGRNASEIKQPSLW